MRLSRLIPVLIVLSMASLGLAPSLAGPAPSPDVAAACDHEEATTFERLAASAVDPKDLPSLLSGVDRDLLRNLADRLQDVPGFVDVHRPATGEERLLVLLDDVGQTTDHDVRLRLATLVPGVPVDLVDVSEAVPSVATGSTEAPVEGVDPPLVPESCLGHRPGRSIGGCTLAFFLTGSDGHVYASTAGHCVGEPGSTASNLGKVVFRIANGVGRDFGLIKVHDHMVPLVDPAMCHWGGPTGLVEEMGEDRVIRQYGYGVLFGTNPATRPRSGVLVSMGPSATTYVGPMTSGDSGSPLRLDSGPALGVHTHGLPGVGFSQPTVKYAMNMVRGIELAEAELGIELQVAVAPVA